MRPWCALSRNPKTSRPSSAPASSGVAITSWAGRLTRCRNGPDQLRIRELLSRIGERVDDVDVTEVIIATDPNTEGEATATYLVRMLRDIPGLTVTRIASGLPMGGDLEFADELTLGRALAGRRVLA